MAIRLSDTTAGREGPEITLDVNCFGCKFSESEYYRVQGDSGCDYYCSHPERGGDQPAPRRHISPFNATTPEWCPLRRSALAAAAERLGAMAAGE